MDCPTGTARSARSDRFLRDESRHSKWCSMVVPFSKNICCAYTLAHTYASELLKAHQASVGIHCSRVTIVQLAKIHWPRWTDDTRHIGRQISPNCNGTLNFKLKSPEKKNRKSALLTISMTCSVCVCCRVSVWMCVCVSVGARAGSCKKHWQETNYLAAAQHCSQYRIQNWIHLPTDKTERIWKKKLFAHLLRQGYMNRIWLALQGPDSGRLQWQEAPAKIGSNSSH